MTICFQTCPEEYLHMCEIYDALKSLIIPDLARIGAGIEARTRFAVARRLLHFRRDGPSAIPRFINRKLLPSRNPDPLVRRSNSFTPIRSTFPSLTIAVQPVDRS